MPSASTSQTAAITNERPTVRERDGRDGAEANQHQRPERQQEPHESPVVEHDVEAELGPEHRGERAHHPENAPVADAGPEAADREGQRGDAGERDDGLRLDQPTGVSTDVRQDVRPRELILESAVSRDERRSVEHVEDSAGRDDAGRKTSGVRGEGRCPSRQATWRILFPQNEPGAENHRQHDEVRPDQDRETREEAGEKCRSARLAECQYERQRPAGRDRNVGHRTHRPQCHRRTCGEQPRGNQSRRRRAELPAEGKRGPGQHAGRQRHHQKHRAMTGDALEERHQHRQAWRISRHQLRTAFVADRRAITERSERPRRARPRRLFRPRLLDGQVAREPEIRLTDVAIGVGTERGGRAVVPAVEHCGDGEHGSNQPNVDTRRQAAAGIERGLRAFGPHERRERDRGQQKRTNRRVAGKREPPDRNVEPTEEDEDRRPGRGRGSWRSARPRWTGKFSNLAIW